MCFKFFFFLLRLPDPVLNDINTENICKTWKARWQDLIHKAHQSMCCIWDLSTFSWRQSQINTFFEILYERGPDLPGWRGWKYSSGKPARALDLYLLITIGGFLLGYIWRRHGRATHSSLVEGWEIFGHWFDVIDVQDLGLWRERQRRRGGFESNRFLSFSDFGLNLF